MELTETKVYKTKVGLFIHEYNTTSGIGGCGKILLRDSNVMYDYAFDVSSGIHPNPESSWHIFRVLDPTCPNHYVKVPNYDLENEIGYEESETY